MKTLLLSIICALHLTTILSAAIEEHYQEKPITIKKADMFESQNQVQIRVGESITYKISVFQDEFFGQTTISANAQMDNTSAQKVKAIYSISFHDKDGKLVGCHQGSWDLNPDEDINYGSGIIFTDEASIKSVTSYKLKTLVLESTED